MKKLLLIILVVGLGGLLWFLHSRTAVTPAASGITATTGAAAPRPPGPGATAAVPGNLKSPAGKYPRWEGGRATSLDDPRWQVMREREKSDPAWQGRMPIDFFGQVVDFDGQPVEGATVEFGWTDLSPAGGTQSTTRSDAAGRFSLTGALGKYLGVEVKKDGYYSSKSNRYAFEYAAFSDENFHQPDSANPVIFRLRKKGRAEALVYRQTFYGLKADGTPQYFDLITGKKTTGGPPKGDIAIRLVRNQSSDPSGYDWTLSLDGIGAAGLVESRDEFMFVAPDAGYESSLVIRQQAGTPNYERQASRNYYVRLADGRTYARLNAEIRPKYNDDGAIDITLFLNPSGSRNLEFDDNKRLPAPER